jgi:hypothetical protein
MLLERQDAELFFRLHWTLMFFVNERLEVIPNKLAKPEEFAVLSPKVQLSVRDALNAKLELIKFFVDENPAHLAEDELDIVRSWRQLVAGRFYVFRELKKYTVFLSTTDPPIAYGVLALSQPFEDLIGPYLPVLIQTVLLPFKDKIIYDGLMNSYNISFGPGIRRSLNESFKEAKLRHGIVTSLPMSDEPMVPTKTPKPKPIPRPQLRDKG